jgi:hypothetical protein
VAWSAGRHSKRATRQRYALLFCRVECIRTYVGTCVVLCIGLDVYIVSGPLFLSLADCLVNFFPVAFIFL